MKFLIISLIILPFISYAQVPDEALLSEELLDEIEKGKTFFDTQEDDLDALRRLEAMKESENQKRPNQISENPYQKRVETDPLKDMYRLYEKQNKVKNWKRREAYIDSRRFKDYKYFLDLEDVVESPIFKATLRKGTSLYSIPDLKKYRLPKDVYVWAHSKSDTEKYIYVLNEDYQIKYKVSRHHVINVEKVAELDVPPETYQEVDYTTKLIPLYDKKLSYSMSAYLQSDYISSNFTSDVVNNSESSTGQALRFSGVGLIKLTTPFDIGVKADYEMASFSGASKTTLSIGPGLRWKAVEIGTEQYHVGIFFQTSVSSKLTFDSESLNLKSNSVELMLSQTFPNHWGAFVWGASVRRNWIKVRSNQGLLAISDTNAVDNSLGVFLGQEF